MSKLAIDTSGKPGVREELSAVGVAGNLKGDSGLFGDGGTVGRVGDEDAGAISVDLHAGKDGAHVFGVRGVAIRHAEKLQAVEIDILFIENADASCGDGGEKWAGIAEFFVVAFTKKCAEGRMEISERLCGAFCVGGRAVEEITGDDDEVRIFTIDGADDARGEATIADVAEM